VSGSSGHLLGDIFDGPGPAALGVAVDVVGHRRASGWGDAGRLVVVGLTTHTLGYWGFSACYAGIQQIRVAGEGAKRFYQLPAKEEPRIRGGSSAPRPASRERGGTRSWASGSWCRGNYGVLAWGIAHLMARCFHRSVVNACRTPRLPSGGFLTGVRCGSSCEITQRR